MTRFTAGRRAQPWVRAYRRRSTDVALESTRAVCAGLGAVSLLAADLPTSTRIGAVLAHVAVLIGALVVLGLLPLAERLGRAGQLAALSTAGTVAFFVVYSATWHDIPHAGRLLGVLALVEAPIRYGVRGLPWSVGPVTFAALTWPQVGVDARTQSPAMVLVLVVLLCGLVVLVRANLHRSARARADATEGLAEATLHLPLGVGVLDARGLVVQANPALTQLLGAELQATLLLDHLDDDDGALAAVLRGRSSEARVDRLTAGGRYVQIGASLLRTPGPARTMVHVRDVTAERLEHADLLHTSRHDALTGLLTRRAGSSLLAESLRAPCADDGTAVLFLDLDGFKRLNDSAGHAVGDEVLRQAAARLAGALRPSEQAARWGGDEFVVVCHGVPDQAAVDAIAQRLLGVLREPYRVQGHPLLTLTASLGAVLSHGHDEPMTVLGAADQAMYAAKEQGGDRWVLAPMAVFAAPAQRSPRLEQPV